MNRWMHEQTGPFKQNHSEIDKNKLLTYVNHGRFSNIMLSRGNQIWSGIYHMTQFTWNSKIRRTNLSWKKADQWLLGTRSKGERLQKNTRKLWGVVEIFCWTHLDGDTVGHTIIVHTIIKTSTGQLKWFLSLYVRWTSIN